MALFRTVGKRALNERFLIGECLSGALVAVAKAQGYQADYVTHLGKAGWQDWNLVRFAVANDYIIVTDNRRDFLKEYARLDIHAVGFARRQCANSRVECRGSRYQPHHRSKVALRKAG